MSVFIPLSLVCICLYVCIIKTVCVCVCLFVCVMDVFIFTLRVNVVLAKKDGVISHIKY